MPSTMSTRAPASSRTVKLSRTTFVVSPGRARCSRASSTSRRSGGTLWKTMAPNGYRNISPPSLGTTSSRTPRRAPGNAGASSRSVRFSSKAMAANSWVVPAIRSPGAALETARCRRTGNVSGTDLEAHSAGSREQGEREWQAHGSALLDQSGRRIGEPLHYPERIHGDLVQVLDSRGGGDVDVGDLTLPVERELDHRPAILVGVELPGGIALAAGVDHLLGPDAADRLLHTVEEAGELEAARVQERSLAFLDAAEIVGHRAARQWTRKADGLIERQLQRALLARRARPDAGALALASRVGDRHLLAVPPERVAPLPVPQGPVGRLGRAQRIAPVLAGQLRCLLLTLLGLAAAILAVVARALAHGRRPRLGLVVAALLLDLGQGVLEERAGLSRPRLLLHAAILLGQVLGRLVRRLPVGGPERDDLPAAQLLLLLGRRRNDRGRKLRHPLLRPGRVGGRAASDPLQLRAVRGHQRNHLLGQVLGPLEHRVLRHAEQQEEVGRDRDRDRQCDAPSAPGWLLGQGHTAVIVIPGGPRRRLGESPMPTFGRAAVGFREHPFPTSCGR